MARTSRLHPPTVSYGNFNNNTFTSSTYLSMVILFYNYLQAGGNRGVTVANWSSLLMQNKKITEIFYKRVSHNRSSTNDPPCSLNRDHGPIWC
jgi:hypothetical protein